LQVVFAWQGDSMVFPATTLRLDCMHLAFDMLAATALFRIHMAPAKGAAALEDTIAGPENVVCMKHELVTGRGTKVVLTLPGAAAAGASPTAMPPSVLEYMGFMRVRFRVGKMIRLPIESLMAPQHSL
jgi:hypothetical protein